MAASTRIIWTVLSALASSSTVQAERRVWPLIPEFTLETLENDSPIDERGGKGSCDREIEIRADMGKKGRGEEGEGKEEEEEKERERKKEELGRRRQIERSLSYFPSCVPD